MRARPGLIFVVLLALGATLVLLWPPSTARAPNATSTTASVPPVGVGAEDGGALRPDPSGGSLPAPATATVPPAATLVLSGTVRDVSSGDLLARVDVAAISTDGVGGLSATTDDDGRFGFDKLPAGRYRLHAVADGYHVGASSEPLVTVPAAAPGPDVEIQMLALAQLSGQVIDDARKVPLGGVDVRCPAPEELAEDSGPGVGWTTSTADGRFDLICFPGELSLKARRDGYRNARSEPVRVAPAGHLGGIILTMRPGKSVPWEEPIALEEPAEPGTLVGRVVDASGSPVARFRIHAVGVRGRARGLPPVARLFVGDGSFSLGGLFPGTYDVLASTDGSSPARAAGAVVPPGGTTDVGTLELEVGASVEGTVTDAASGRGIAGVSVTVTGSMGDVAPYLGTDVFTDESGSFRMDGLLPGRRSVELSHPAYNHSLRTGVELEAGEVATVDATLSARTSTRGSIEYAGIGAVIGRAGVNLVVQRVFDGGPARAAGLAAGDVVVSIDGVSTGDLGFTDAIEALRGVAGTTVRLEVFRDGETFAIDVVRAQLVMPPAGG